MQTTDKRLAEARPAERHAAKQSHGSAAEPTRHEPAAHREDGSAAVMDEKTGRGADSEATCVRSASEDTNREPGATDSEQQPVRTDTDNTDRTTDDTVIEAASDGDDGDDGDDYPEGGRRAWLCVAGGWCAMFAVYGLSNCLGLFLTYYVEGPLRACGPGPVSWIVTVQLYVQSASGVVFGRLFDRYGPPWLLWGGGVAYMAGLAFTSLATDYYAIFLAQSVLAAAGSGALFNVALACAATWFRRRRAAALGLLVSGSSLGGVLLPVVFHRLQPPLGFPSALRVVALLLLPLCVVAALTVRSRLRPRPRPRRLRDYARPLAEPAFAWTVLAGFFFLLGMFIPINYVVLEAEAAGMSASLAPYLLSIINAAGFFGRIVPGFVADRVGRYNTMTAIMALSAVVTLAVWVPGQSSGALIAFGVVFGFASGGYVSLGTPCLAQISDIRDIGVRTGTAYLLQALGGLLGSPMAGAIVSATGGRYLGLKLLAGLSMAVGVLCNAAARYAQIRPRWRGII